MQLPSRFEKICANLFILTITIFLTLIFSDLLMKYVFFHPSYNFKTAGWLDGRAGELKIELIPDNLFKFQPNKKLGINKYGFRDHDLSTQKQGAKRIVFIGDSFTMGLNVRSEETMPKALEKLLKNYEVYNMGMVGFGPDQELNILEKYGFKFKPDMVIEGICSQNDSGDIYFDQLYTVGPKGELQATQTNPVKSMIFNSPSSIVNAINFLKKRENIVGTLNSLLLGDNYDLTWMKYRDSGEAMYKYSLMRAIFKKMRDDVNSRNIDFLAIIIPSQYNICDDKFFKEMNVDPNAYFANEETYQSILESEKIPYINLVPFFMRLNKDQRCSLYDGYNGHLSAFGNLYAAQIISLYMAAHQGQGGS
jgi:hypothetical protein